MPFTRRTTLGLLAGAFVAPDLAQAQEFPSQVIKIVVPYPPGGPTDALARIVALEIGQALGHGAIVENQPGGSGAIGARAVARSVPDGHTLCLGNNQTHATNASLMSNPGYDPIRDFTPVAGLADLQHALVVRKDLGVSNVAALVSLAKKYPGKLNYGSTGVGSGSHLAMELFKTRTGTQMQHVPFRGAAPMAQEILAGRIDVAFATLPSVLGLVQAGEMNAIAIASHVRAPQVPDVPLLKEQGIIDGEADSWLALFAPAATPPAHLEKLSSAVLAALAKEDIKANIIKQGIALNVRPPEAFKTYLAAEVEKWAQVIRDAHVKTDG